MVERLTEPLLVHRFQKVIERMHFERAHGVAIIGRDKNRQWKFACLLQCFDDAEAIDFGHLDIKENEIGFFVLDKCDGRLAVAAFGDDFQVGFFLQ